VRRAANAHDQTGRKNASQSLVAIFRSFVAFAMCRSTIFFDRGVAAAAFNARRCLMCESICFTIARVDGFLLDDRFFANVLS
jgi:hypothetical protein